MNPEPLSIMIMKPIYGTYCSIDLRRLREAVQNHQMLKITIFGVGSAIVDPKWWYETAVKIEKRVVRFTHNPMTFIYNTVPIASPLLKNKEKVKDQMELL